MQRTTKDLFYAATGAVIFAALRIVDVVQTAVRVEPPKRRLTEHERALLFPIFRDSLAYDLIEVVDGQAGLLTVSGRALTMGSTIYLPAYREKTLVHECVHVWQFRYGGFRYIGNSAVHQLESMVFDRSYRPYDWRPGLNAGSCWYQLRSVEAQAKFMEDVFARGVFAFDAPGTPDDDAPGAFFREDEAGHNAFREGERDYTGQANAAWHSIRTEDQPRRLAWWADSTAVMQRWRTSATSSSVRVWSGASRRRLKARLRRPSAMPGPR
jgi:hypothetical protein